jgi:vanillate O-demethylase monooxygenase subunit
LLASISENSGDEILQLLENLWYCAALKDEVSAKPMRRVICGMPMVFYQTEAGEPVALEDRCSHRHAPLSLGNMIDDEIHCLYHGYVFDRTGSCTHIPHQKGASANAAIRSFPIVERWGLLWVWWGDAAESDRALIPDLSWTEAPDKRPIYIYFYVNANHQLVADNLLDVSHADYLHSSTFGSNSGKKGGAQPDSMTMETTTSDGKVNSYRKLENVTVGPLARKWGGFTKELDRVNTQMWEPPNIIHVQLELMNDENHICLNHDHIMTPETDKTTHYFMDATRDFGVENVGYPTDEDIYNEHYSVISGEDIPMIEAQQANIDLYDSLRDVPAKADRLVDDVHRLLRDLYANANLTLPPEVRRTGPV